jgi:hypothetical protein
LAVNAGRSSAANFGSGDVDDDGAGAVVDPADELPAVQAELIKPAKTAAAPTSHTAEGGPPFSRPMNDIDDPDLLWVFHAVSRRVIAAAAG